MGSREFFAARWEAEAKAFVNVMRAMPEGHGDYRPHPRSRSAAELAWVLTCETVGILDLIERGELEWQETPPPARLHDIAVNRLEQWFCQDRAANYHFIPWFDRYAVIYQYIRQFFHSQISHCIFLAFSPHRRQSLYIYPTQRGKVDGRLPRGGF